MRVAKGTQLQCNEPGDCLYTHRPYSDAGYADLPLTLLGAPVNIVCFSGAQSLRGARGHIYFYKKNRGFFSKTKCKDADARFLRG
jgi:hypothetical protein